MNVQQGEQAETMQNFVSDVKLLLQFEYKQRRTSMSFNNNNNKKNRGRKRKRERKKGKRCILNCMFFYILIERCNIDSI